MGIRRFEDIIAWQKAKVLSVEIYKTFEASKDFGFKDQIQRASVSVMNNIAEGYERKGKVEFKRFLTIAKSSCGEVRSMLYLGLELKKLEKENFDHLNNQTIEISKMLARFIQTLS